MTSETKQIKCNFCGRSTDEVDDIIAGGPESVYICGICVDACVRIINDNRNRHAVTQIHNAAFNELYGTD